MKRNAKIFFPTVATLLLWEPVGLAHQDIHDAATRYRHEAMKAADAHRKALGDALEAGGPFRSQTPNHAKALRTLVDAIPRLFPKDGDHSESDASPKIWKDWNDFVSKADEAGRIAADLETATTAENWDAAKGHLQKLGKACKGCHDPYRD